MNAPSAERLIRPLQAMPRDIAERLAELSLRGAHDARPAYQRNDYLAWIGRAKRPETREKRLVPMLEELAGGDRYMHMAWRGAQR